jgi:hypothetical protein
VFGETVSSAVDPGPGPEWRFNAQPVPGPSIDPARLGQGFTSYEPLLLITTNDIPTLGRDASPQPTLPSTNHQIPFSGSPFTSRATTTLSSSPSSLVIRGSVQLSSSNSSSVRSSISSVAPSTTTSPHSIARAAASPFTKPIDPAPRPQLQKCTFCDKAFPSGPPSARGSISHHVNVWHGYLCKYGCVLGFQSERDRERHYGTQAHKHSQPRWTCGCGKSDHRRDNHLRHLRHPESCKNNSGSYICGLCGHSESGDRKRHYQHVMECKKRRGKKPKARTM